MKDKYIGWAIKWQYPGYYLKNGEYHQDKPFLVGVLFFSEPPEHCAGIRTCVFQTQKRAREAMKKEMYDGIGKVVKVRVTIEEVE